jgi:hypothetical protein
MRPRASSKRDRQVIESTAIGWVLAGTLLAACSRTHSSAPDASAAVDSVAAADATTDASPSADAEAGASDAAAVRGEGELTLEVQGGYCPVARRSLPECRSYTYVLHTDGKLRGGKRRSDVPPEEVDAVFDLALTAFAAAHACIPNAPDRGGQAITLRWNGKTQAARGGCGPRFEELRTRLEKLAAAAP